MPMSLNLFVHEKLDWVIGRFLLSHHYFPQCHGNKWFNIVSMEDHHLGDTHLTTNIDCQSPRMDGAIYRSRLFYQYIVITGHKVIY